MIAERISNRYLGMMLILNEEILEYLKDILVDLIMLNFRDVKFHVKFQVPQARPSAAPRQASRAAARGGVAGATSPPSP
ncbi:hypothetical protein [Pyrodictium occultum]|uniref:hypothetical protein n=1 Tax=Pyrodictium occultum TaxID=2309 RepID=UPI00144362FE|nr:hypothetical protein [Pyrodictium occultum]